jgi:hypothetical protein
LHFFAASAVNDVHRAAQKSASVIFVTAQRNRLPLE